MKKINRIISFILVIALLSGLSIIPSAHTADKIGSLLDSYTPDSTGVFTITSSSRIYIISDTAPDDSILKTASLIARQAGTHFVFDGEHAVGDQLSVLDLRKSYGGGNSGGIHACGAENAGIDRQDVRHRHEGGDTRHYLGFDIGSVFAELEELFDHRGSFLSFSCDEEVTTIVPGYGIFATREQEYIKKKGTTSASFLF